MAIQWFPGHMNKAKKQVAETMAKVDVVIEMLDARLPMSSCNPLVKQLRQHRQRPSLKLLNKSDLADPQVTQAWVRTLQQEPGVKVLTAGSEDKAERARRLVEGCRQLAPHRTGQEKPLRAMILGVPNVGKSTLLNILLQRKIAEVADRPGVTKNQQRVELAGGMIVVDTPGLMWPKIAHEAAGFRLALSGAIGVNAYDEEEVAWFALDYLRQRYPQALLQRYKLKQLPDEDEALLAAIAVARGCRLPGGVLDTRQAAEKLLVDFRSGQLGRISLETPDDWLNIEAEVAQPDAGPDDDEAGRG